MSTLTMERILAAPKDKVFAYITQPAFLLQWWGPEGIEIGENKPDFSHPGPWAADMLSAMGAHRVGGQVLHVDPPNSVTFTLFHVAPDGSEVDETTINFALAENAGGGTHFTLTQTGVKPEYLDDMRDKGWNSALARLQRLASSQLKN